ncbi:hypothetical protein L218DRAFT_1065208 [Marasmius fiardii PR-910]|nr:hypothetical protein L218DRAFT_1065208 [Marasmius fiardii PR-910]
MAHFVYPRIYTILIKALDGQLWVKIGKADLSPEMHFLAYLKEYGGNRVEYKFVGFIPVLNRTILCYDIIYNHQGNHLSDQSEHKQRAFEILQLLGYKKQLISCPSEKEHQHLEFVPLYDMGLEQVEKVREVLILVLQAMYLMYCKWLKGLK